MTFRIAAIALLAVLASCATRLPPPVPLFVEVEPHVPPTPGVAQIVFLSPAAAPTRANANALYSLDGGHRTLIAALAGHTGSFQGVTPGHHVFMTFGRSRHLLDVNVEGGCRYCVLLRADGDDDLVPLPMRMTEDAEITNRSSASGQWILDSTMVEKTPAADIFFARKSPQVDAAQADALAAWQRKTPQARAALTLEPADAELRILR